MYKFSADSDPYSLSVTRQWNDKEHVHSVYSSIRGQTRSRENTSTGVVHSRYDCNNRHHE